MSTTGDGRLIDTHDDINPLTSGPRTQMVRADRRTVTAFFCDIVNSSHMVIPADPEDAYDQISGLIDIMRRHVGDYGGTVCQTLGDGIYAIFGAPIAQENHAVRACYAADGILREIARGTRAVRIGMASGEVLWDHGVTGTANTPATGATVHIAAKLQQIARANTAIMADGTARLVGDWVETRQASLVVLGGDGPLQTHQLASVRNRRRQDDDELPMVGRDGIRNFLTTAMDHLSDPKMAFAAHLVQAAPGLGKTRLVRDLAQHGRIGGLRVVEWQIPVVEPVGAQGPLHWLVAELLDGPLPRTVDGLSSRLQAAGARPEAADALSQMLLPAASGCQEVGAASVLTLAAAAIAALAEFVAGRRPLVLVVEDVHWADTAVQAVLSALLNLPKTTPVLLVMTSREEGLATAIEHCANLRRHHLLPLNTASTSTLLDVWVGSLPALDSMKRELARRANGNPLFLVESIRVLMMNGTLTGPLGDMRPGELPVLSIPDSVQALLTVRVDMLEEKARRMLRAAAVIGQTFDAGLLMKLMADKADASSLQDLVRLKLIDDTRVLPRQEYSFHHALLHEVVYAGLTRRDRRQLHASLALLLDQDSFAEMSGRLAAQARHAMTGEMWAIAVRAGAIAGREALSRSKAVEAVGLFGIAVDANEKLTNPHGCPITGIDLRIALAKAAMPAGMAERAVAELETAVDLARRAGDTSRAMVGLVQQVNYEWVYGNLECALRLIDSAISHSGGVTATHPEILAIAASCYIEYNEPKQALELLDAACANLRTSQHTLGQYTILDVNVITGIKRARCLSLLGRDGEAEPHIQSAIERAADSPHLFNRAFARSDAAEIRLRQRRYADVLGYCSEILSVSRTTGSSLLDSVSLARRGLALASLGRGEAGLTDIEQGVRMAAMRGAVIHLSKARLCKSLALALTGQGNAAQDELAAATALAAERGHRLLLNGVPSAGDLVSIGRQAGTYLVGSSKRYIPA